jgi:DNA helicase-2/ATP-dependent DNA helicase PcrA
MDTDELLHIIEDRLGFVIDEEKLDVINHGPGPLQVVAGPGSGKTELIPILAVKKIFVEECNPKSVIITTFTEKGAKNLRDRILRYAGYVFTEHPGLEKKIDLSSLRIGTLHSLCADIMQEYRYEGYENYRLLDEIEQYLFGYDHATVARDTKTKQIYRDLWANLPYLFDHFGRPYLNSSFLIKTTPLKRHGPKLASRSSTVEPKTSLM